MFTTSRSGTPRRSLAPRSRAGTPAKSVYDSPPGGSGRRASSTGFHQTTPAPAALETRKPVEDSHTLVLDENHRVSLGFSVPHELQHAMDACGLTYGDMLSFSLDFNANYALLIAPTCVYAWNFGKKVTPNNSNSLTFAVPPSNISPHDLAVAVYAPVPLAALVNYPSGREPGLVVCSVDGHLRFWDSLSVALTGVERFSTALLPQLEKGEIVRHLISISVSLLSLDWNEN